MRLALRSCDFSANWVSVFAAGVAVLTLLRASFISSLFVLIMMSMTNNTRGADARPGGRAGDERNEAGKAPAAPAGGKELLERAEGIRRGAEQLRALASRLYYDLIDAHRVLAERGVMLVRSELDWCILDALASRMLRRALGIVADAEAFLAIMEEEVAGDAGQ